MLFRLKDKKPIQQNWGKFENCSKKVSNSSLFFCLFVSKIGTKQLGTFWSSQVALQSDIERPCSFFLPVIPLEFLCFIFCRTPKNFIIFQHFQDTWAWSKGPNDKARPTGYDAGDALVMEIYTRDVDEATSGQPGGVS